MLVLPLFIDTDGYYLKVNVYKKIFVKINIVVFKILSGVHFFLRHHQKTFNRKHRFPEIFISSPIVQTFTSAGYILSCSAGEVYYSVYCFIAGRIPYFGSQKTARLPRTSSEIHSLVLFF